MAIPVDKPTMPPPTIAKSYIFIRTPLHFVFPCKNYIGSI
jgi:hypothetical protein